MAARKPFAPGDCAPYRGRGGRREARFAFRHPKDRCSPIAIAALVAVMTNLDISEGQALQLNSAHSEDYRGARQLQKLKKRLRRRVRRLRILAYAFLVLAILVLAGGAAVFGYANYIARLTLSPPPTASAQYDMATDTNKRLSEQLAALNNQREEILNEAVITAPANEKMENIKAEYRVLEDDILQHCPKKTLNNFIDPDFGFGWSDASMTVRPSPLFDYRFGLPSGRSVSFESLDLANDCRNHFEEHREEIIRYTRRWLEVANQRNKMLEENSKSKFEKLAPINEQYKKISVKV
jgi:hypothetical protein